MSKMNIDITIRRTYLSDCVTGVLELQSGWRCVTLERPDLDNEQMISCIPEGTYEYFYREDGANGKVFELTNVVNRTVIQIHIGNYVRNSVGCILVAKTLSFLDDNSAMIGTSGDTMKLLLEKAPHKGIIKIMSGKD